MPIRFCHAPIGDISRKGAKSFLDRIYKINRMPPSCTRRLNPDNPVNPVKKVSASFRPPPNPDNPVNPVENSPVERTAAPNSLRPQIPRIPPGSRRAARGGAVPARFRAHGNRRIRRVLRSYGTFFNFLRLPPCAGCLTFAILCTRSPDGSDALFESRFL